MRIVYVAGCSRSGSTLLLRLLGELPGVVAPGELFDVWQRGYLQNQLCGCGAEFHRCPFWREVTERAFGRAPDEVPAARYDRLRRDLLARGGIARLWLPALRSRRYVERLRAYAAVFGRLYEAIGKVADAGIVVDSSKQPRHGWLLREVPGVEVHVVHLVRDPRAVAFSWRRDVARPEIHWRAASMERRSLGQSAMDWDAINLLTPRLRSWAASYTLVRYEDLVRRPASALASAGEALGERWDLEGIVRGGRVNLTPSHTASGNPSRFAAGPTDVREDDEWRLAMATGARFLVTALTAPLLARYGYAVLSPRAAVAADGR